MNKIFPCECIIFLTPVLFKPFIILNFVLFSIYLIFDVYFICSFFPVFSADAEKIAELQLSVVLESIMGKGTTTQPENTISRTRCSGFHYETYNYQY